MTIFLRAISLVAIFWTFLELWTKRPLDPDYGLICFYSKKKTSCKNLIYLIKLYIRLSLKQEGFLLKCLMCFKAGTIFTLFQNIICTPKKLCQKSLKRIQSQVSIVGHLNFSPLQMCPQISRPRGCKTTLTAFLRKSLKKDSKPDFGAIVGLLAQI